MTRKTIIGILAAIFAIGGLICTVGMINEAFGERLYTTTTEPMAVGALIMLIPLIALYIETCILMAKEEHWISPTIKFLYF